MVDSNLSALYSSQWSLSSGDTTELEQRLGLYQVFLKLYEHNQSLLDEILDLENSSEGPRRSTSLYIQGIICDQAVYLTTNLLQGKTQALTQPEQIWTIGRDRKNSLPIRDKRLSRHHAAIQYKAGQGFYLVDLKSTNGSFVNGEKVWKSHLLKDGDSIRLGSLSFSFFVCNTFQALDSLSPDLLRELNHPGFVPAEITANSRSCELPDNEIAPLEVEEEMVPANVEDTSLFLTSPPVDELIPAPLPLSSAQLFNSSRPDPLALSPVHLSSAQQSEILDRFLQRPGSAHQP